ncbi:MAG: hypothetical protein A3H95_16035 [Acidobacteria bacterium RIFCSPLOWO2_02_FULL_64_15]|nr:MAG: hypothetical protein A3H95_16035 [Acidobacteria bacterium RIFCSPLOWO2_02_FULL_64_15]
MSSVFGLIRGFYIARTMVPADYGVWSLVAALLSYANYADTGVNTGFILEVPRLIGVGHMDQAIRVQRQAFTATLLVTGVVAALVFTGSFWPGLVAGQYGANLRIVAAGVVVFGLLNYYQVVARIEDRWQAIGAATIATTIVSTAGVVVAGTVTGHLTVEASALFAVLGSAAAVLMLFAGKRSAPAWQVDWAVLRRLMAIGLPVSLWPLGFTAFQNADRWIVAGAVSRTDLGYYGLGTTFGLFLYLVPNTLAMVLFTRQIAAFGATGDPRKSESIVLPPIQASGYVMAWLAGAMVLAMPFIVHYVTPSYSPALRVATLQVIGNCLLFAMPVAANYLISTKRQALLVAIVGVVALFEIALVAVLVRTKLGIDGAAWAVLVSDGLCTGAVVTVCLRLFDIDLRAALSRVCLYFLPFALCLPVALLLSPFGRVTDVPSADGAHLLLLGIAYVGLSVPLCLAASKMSGFLAEPVVAARVRTHLPGALSTFLLGRS